MHALDVLGDPVHRRILELLADGEHSSGAVTEVIEREFGISQSTVSQHLRVLRDSGLATVRVEGARRIYAVDAAPLREVDARLLDSPPRRARDRDRARKEEARRLIGGQASGAASTPREDPVPAHVDTQTKPLGYDSGVGSNRRPRGGAPWLTPSPTPS